MNPTPPITASAEHIFNQQQPKRALFVGLDLETTESDPSRARIIQLATVAQCPGLPADGKTGNLLLHPGCPIPASATAIHGITDAMCEGRQTFLEALPTIVGLVRSITQPGTILVGYNIRRFDWPLLLAALAEQGVTLQVSPLIVDMFDLVAWYYRGWPSRKLGDVAEKMGVGFAPSIPTTETLTEEISVEECSAGKPRNRLAHQIVLTMR